MRPTRTPYYEQRTNSPGAPQLALMQPLEHQGEDAIANALSHVGANQLRIDERDAAVEASDKLSALNMRALQRYTDAQSTAAEDGAGFTPGLIEQFDSDLDETLANTKSPLAKSFIKERSHGIKESLFHRATEFEVGARSQYRKMVNDRAAERLSAVVQSDPDSYQRVGEEQMLAIEAQGLPPEERVVAREKMRHALTGAAALGYAAQDPEGTLKKLHEGGDSLFDGLDPSQRHLVMKAATGQIVDAHVEGVMSAYDRNAFAGTQALAALDQSNLSPELKNEAQKEIRERVSLLRDQRRQEYVEPLAALHADIADGKPADDAERKALGLYARGAMTEEQYSSTLASIARARVEHAKEGVDVNAGLQAITLGTPLDPKDDKIRKSIDAAFGQLTSGVAQGAPEWQSAAIQIARTTNIAPSSAISWARSAVTSNNPDAAAGAAWFLRKMEQANGQAFRYVDDDKLKSFSELVSSAMAAGAPSKDAVETARKNTYELTDPQRATLKAQYQDAIKNTITKRDPANELQRRLDGDDRFDQSLLHGAPTAPPAMAADFNAARERYFVSTGGDMDAAGNLAWRDVTRKWGYSAVNGKPELMPYAPEAMFPQLPVEVIKEDMRRAVQSDPNGFPIDVSRPVIQNPDGSHSTESSITVEMEGRFVNIPTIWNGARVDEKTALDNARAAISKGEVFPNFKSLKQAEAAAVARSEAIDAARSLDPSRIRLVPSPETASSGGIRWNIGTVGPYGTVEILRKPNGLPRQYDLPVTAKAFGETVDALKKTEQAKAREFTRARAEELKAMEQRIREGGDVASQVPL